MSYEISMRNTCSSCGHNDYSFERNVSWNYHPAFVKMFKDDNGIRGLEHLTGAQMIPVLLRAVGDMAEHTDDYVGIMPSNGWGDFNDLTCLIQAISDAAMRHPTHKFEVY